MLVLRHIPCHLQWQQAANPRHSALPVMSSTAKSRDLFVGWRWSHGHPSPHKSIHEILVGGCTNPLAKYDRQIGSSHPGKGEKKQKKSNHHPGYCRNSILVDLGASSLKLWCSRNDTNTSPGKWWINECEQQSPALRSAEMKKIGDIPKTSPKVFIWQEKWKKNKTIQLNDTMDFRQPSMRCIYNWYISSPLKTNIFHAPTWPPRHPASKGIVGTMAETASSAGASPFF